MTSIKTNVREAVEEMKDGNCPDLNRDFGEFRDKIESLSEYIQEDDQDGFKNQLAQFVNNNPEFAGIVSSPPSGWDVHSLADVENIDIDLSFLVDDLIAEPSLNLLVGPPGSLKSMLSIDLGMSVAAGTTFLPTDFFGRGTGYTFECEQGTTLLVDLENRQASTINRLEATQATVSPSNPEDYMFVHQPSDPSLRVPEQGVEELILKINEVDADLVIVDNLRDSCLGMDENTSEMAEVMEEYKRVVEETQVALLMLHHTRKDQSGGREGSNIRGSSAIEAAADSVVMIDRMSDSSPFVTISQSKNRFGEEKSFGAEWSYQNDQNGNLTESCFFGHRSFSGKTHKQLKAERGILETLEGDQELNQSEIVGRLKRNYGVGKNTVHDQLDHLHDQGDIEMSRGANNSKLYSLSDEFASDSPSN